MADQVSRPRSAQSAIHRDLSAELVCRAPAAGCKPLANRRLAFGSDAHAPEYFDFLRLGVLTARRGRVEASAVLNAGAARS
jgi:histidinol phosphatase-like PHP family hydrolase